MSNSTQSNASKVAETLANATNTGINTIELREQFANEHRYLQSEIFLEVVKPIILELADAGVDARNKKAVEEAREIVEHMEWYDE